MGPFDQYGPGLPPQVNAFHVARRAALEGPDDPEAHSDMVEATDALAALLKAAGGKARYGRLVYYTDPKTPGVGIEQAAGTVREETEAEMFARIQRDLDR